MKSDKKAGGQQGHEGSTLAFSAFPDEIITHIPDYCHQCGDDLSGVRSIELKNRQVIDIPIPVPVSTELSSFEMLKRMGTKRFTRYFLPTTHLSYSMRFLNLLI